MFGSSEDNSRTIVYILECNIYRPICGKLALVGNSFQTIGTFHKHLLWVSDEKRGLKTFDPRDGGFERGFEKNEHKFSSENEFT